MASRRWDAEEIVDMLSDVDTEDSDDDLGEPICPGSDIEFPLPDSNEERYYFFIMQQFIIIIDWLINQNAQNGRGWNNISCVCVHVWGMHLHAYVVRV